MESNEHRTGPAQAGAGDQGSLGMTCPAAGATARPKKTTADPVHGTL